MKQIKLFSKVWISCILILSSIHSIGQNIKHLNAFKGVLVNLSDDSQIKPIIESSLRKRGYNVVRLESMDCDVAVLEIYTYSSPNSLNCGKMGIRIKDCLGNLVADIGRIQTINAICNYPYTCCFDRYGQVFERYLRRNNVRFNYNPQLYVVPIEQEAVQFEEFDITDESSVREYFDNTELDDIQGIWRSATDPAMPSYKLIILKEGFDYNGFVLEKQGLFQVGVKKFSLESTAVESIFTMSWTMGDLKTNKTSLAAYEDGVITFKIDDEDKALYKLYPKLQIEKPALRGEEEWLGNGSGVLVDDRGYVLTNYHVIEDANKIAIVVEDEKNKKEVTAEVFATDPINDLAILQIKDEKYSPFGEINYSIDWNTVDIGLSVYALGYPLALDVMGEELKVTDGIISAKSGFDGDIRTYQISAPIQNGNSGGALFTEDGILTGITSSGLDKSVADNVSYAIKISYAKNLLELIPDWEYKKAPPYNPNQNKVEVIKNLSHSVVLVKVK